MSRLLVDGYLRQQLAGFFADTNPVAVEPTVPAGVLRHGDFSDNPDGYEQFFGSIKNNDDIAHNFRCFIRGTGVPGGSVELGAPTNPAPYAINALAAGGNALGTDFQPTGLWLMPGQRLDYEMVEAVDATAPAWQNAIFDRLIQNIVVKGYVPGNQIDLVTRGAPSVLAGPPSGARLRRVDCGYLAEFMGATQSFFFNSDYDAAPPNGTKTVTFTLLDPINGDRDLYTTTETSKGVLPLRNLVELLPGQSLACSVQEATVTTSPWMFWYFEDVL